MKTSEPPVQGLKLKQSLIFVGFQRRLNPLQGSGKYPDPQDRTEAT